MCGVCVCVGAGPAKGSSKIMDEEDDLLSLMDGLGMDGLDLGSPPKSNYK